MIRAISVISSGQEQHEAADSVTLDFDARHRRRLAMKGANGTEFLLDLAKATALRQGDLLRLEDGRIIEVHAALEDLVEISAATPSALIRLAWHLGNRHLPTQLLGDRIRIRRDHVIEEMLRRLGGVLTPVVAGFDPEGGAYGVGEIHEHDHAHSHGEHHDQASLPHRR